ncbi:PorV/PorQ family protein [candidate division WOR-3 bacterium]|nr:PorV/PorQ family protein [candidate division WOR-3 bacterium]
MLIFFIIQAFFSTGTGSHQFLELGFGARAVAMGGAYTAVTDDAYSMFWNPAGSRISKKFGATFSFSTLFEDAYLASGAMKFGLKGMGVFSGGFAFFSTKDIERDELGNEYKEFSISDLAVAFSYAYRPRKKLTLGLGGKGIYSQLYDYTSYSASLDCGILLNPFKWLYLGGSLRELGTGARFYKKRDFSPTSLSGGVAIKTSILKLLDFTLASDVKASRNSGLEWMIGAEGKLIFFSKKGAKDKEKRARNEGMESISLRLGYKPGEYFSGEWNGFSYGLGIEYPISRTNISFRLDVVYINYGYFGEVEHFSLSLIF